MQRAMCRSTGYSMPMRYQPYPSYSSPYRGHYSSSPSSYSPSTSSTYQNMQSGIDYGSYSGSSHGLPFSRPNSYSNAFSPYDAETTSQYASQPPSFILPNTDPAGNTNPYLMNSYGNKSQSSQAWSEQPTSASLAQSVSQIMAAGYALPSSEALMAYQGGQTPTSDGLKFDQSLPYQSLSSQQPPMLSSDRTLPNPSARNYGAPAISSLDRSPLDSIPLSAVSHRSSLGSSLGWQTDTASSSSQISCQTSCSSVGGSQDYGTDRGPMHRDSQDLSYGYMGYSNSPHTTLPPNTLSSITNDTHSNQSSLSVINDGDPSSQRCRTISSEGHHNDSPSATASSSYGYTGATVARTSQTRTASGQLSNGATYTRAQPSITRRENAVGAEDCTGVDCSGCQTGSNRASIASINNLSNY